MWRRSGPWTCPYHAINGRTKSYGVLGSSNAFIINTPLQPALRKIWYIFVPLTKNKMYCHKILKSFKDLMLYIYFCAECDKNNPMKVFL